MNDLQNKQADGSGGLDELFRSSLSGHQIEPSGKVWKGISRKLLRAELAHFNFTNLHKAYWVGGASALIIGFIFLFNQIHDGSTGETNTNVNAGSTIATAQSSAARHNTTTAKENPSANSVRNVSALHNANHNNESKVLANNNLNRSNVNRKHEAFIPSTTTSITTSTSISGAPEELLLNTNQRTREGSELKSMPSIAGDHLYSTGVEDTLLRFTTLNGINNIPVVTKVKVPQFFSADLGLTPEVSVYRNTSNYSETNFWLNAGLTYHAGRFSVGTGVGLGYVFDHGDYTVNYKSKDSIGYFTSIISFIVTPNNEVVYTTKDIAVYDSLQHAADSRAQSRYTYLQIPLLLGFEIFESNRFSVTIKAGPAVSFLIASKEAAPFIDYPNARLVRVDDNSPDRVKINWEIQAALDIEYRLVKNFSIFALPSYKHYFNAFETQESTTSQVKDPYSIGITLGARYNFGLKNSKP